MAVKTSWSSGDVLTAADLTDTFAAKGDIAGETWTGTHDFSGATVSGITSGLSLITRAAFSSVSAVSVDDCFSSAYDHYRILFTVTSSSATGIATMRLRASSVDNASAVYDRQLLEATSATVSSGTSNNQTKWNIAYVNSSYGGWTAVVADIQRPNLATYTSMVMNQSGISSAGNYSVWLYGAIHKASTAWDGVTFAPASGTFTGDISIYGYAKA